MHVVATNIVMWIRTLIKETMEEVSEIGEKHFHKETSAEHYMVRFMTVLSLFKNVALILYSQCYFYEIGGYVCPHTPTPYREPLQKWKVQYSWPPCTNGLD